MTVVSTVPWWWALWLRFNWRRTLLSRRLRIGSKKAKRLRALASIVFARWSLLDRMPPGRARRAGRRMPHRYSFLIFQSNFNGSRDLYLEVFAVAFLWKIRALWWGAYGVPDLLPLSRFLSYAADKDIEPAHYYCAYPEGTVKTIGAAMELRGHHEEFARKARALEGPEQFADEYRKFLARVKGLL
jgi:hypothetical protein